MLSFTVKTEYLTKSNSWQKILQLNLMCKEDLCQRIRTDSCRKNIYGTLTIVGPT